MHARRYLPPFLSSLQLLLDLHQGRVPTLRHGGVEVWDAVEGRGLEDDLEGLARRPLVQLDHLHVFDDAPAQIHRICGVGSSPCAQIHSGPVNTQRTRKYTVGDEEIC